MYCKVRGACFEVLCVCVWGGGGRIARELFFIIHWKRGAAMALALTRGVQGCVLFFMIKQKILETKWDTVIE
jgi:hypothetical protein